MKHTPTRIVAFGAIAGLLALSACGSDDDATPAEEAASVVSEAAAEQEAVTSEVAAEVGDIVETAINAGSFDTLVAAVTAASLVETLQSAPWREIVIDAVHCELHLESAALTSVQIERVADLATVCRPDPLGRSAIEFGLALTRPCFGLALRVEGSALCRKA